METCLYDILKLFKRILYPSSKVIIVIDIDKKENELNELREAIQKTRMDLNRIMLSRSNTELIEVQRTLCAANHKMQDYNIQINKQRQITIQSL